MQYEFAYIFMNLSKGWQKAIKTAKMQDNLQEASFRAVQLCK